MSGYQPVQLGDEDTAPDITSVNATSNATSSYPPAYPSGAGLAWQQGVNYIHRATKNIQGTFFLDSDIAPELGRFRNEQERTEAKNAYFVTAGKMEIILYLRGQKKTSIKVECEMGEPAVLDIRSDTSANGTVRMPPIDLEVVLQGRSSTIILPPSYQGGIGGPCKLSDAFAMRSKVLVEDKKHPEKCRQLIQAEHPASNPVSIPAALPSTAASDEEETSFITITATQAPKCYITTYGENEDKKLEEEEKVARIRKRFGLPGLWAYTIKKKAPQHKRAILIFIILGSYLLFMVLFICALAYIADE